MNLKNIFRVLFLLLPLVVGNGCVTKALLQNGNLDACKEPASDASLRLFSNPNRDDFLVVYNEYSERNDAIRTKAYWLNENEPRIKQGRAPHFVKANGFENLPAVPVYLSIPMETNQPPTIYALEAADRQSFKLYSDRQLLRACNLPVYNDGKGKYERAALMPIAVTADLTIVGGIIGYWYLVGVAGGDRYDWPATR